MRFVGWLVAFVLLLGAAGWLALGPNDALAQSAAVDDGTAERVEATLEVVHETRTKRRSGKGDRTRKDKWVGHCRPFAEAVEVNEARDFGVPRDEEKRLRSWDGTNVTCHLWTDDTVIAVEGPDGTVLKRGDVGVRGVAVRWLGAALALGAALLIGGLTLRMGTITAVAGGVLAGAAGLALLHLEWLWVAVIVDVVVVLGVVGLAVVVLGRRK
jgi:hypothetical protein